MFPYKTTFVKTSPAEFLRNLRERQGLIEVIKHPGYELPSAMISEPVVYDAVNILTDLYTEPARVKANLFRLCSPLEYWQKNEAKIRAEARARFGNEDNFSLRETIYFTCKEATAFSPVLSKCVYDHLLPVGGGSVLDPFSGWGDRAIGALGSDRVTKYQGVDCNLDLTEGYQRLKADLDTTGKLNFDMVPFEDFKSEAGYDLIFTSPPFFDFEVYSDAKTQSISGKKGYKDWFNGWMTPVLKKMVALLKEGGLIALYIGPTNRAPTLHNDVWHVLTQVCKISYVSQIDCSLRDKKSIPIWVYRKDRKDRKDRKEQK